METISQNTNTNSTVGAEMKNSQMENVTMTTAKQREDETLKQMIRDHINKSKVKVSNTDNKSEDNQIDESKVEQSDSVKAEIVIKNPKYDIYVSQLTPYIDDTKSIIGEMYSKALRLTHNYIQIGNILTDAKQTLSKDDYESLIKNFDINERTAYRYIKLVKNDKVSNLSLDNMSSMLNPSIGKLMKMHSLSDDEFNSVLCGDDKPLLPSPTNGTDTNTYPLSTQIDNNTFDELKKKTKIEIMQYFLDDIAKLKQQLSDTNSENSALFEIISINDISFDVKNEKIS